MKEADVAITPLPQTNGALKNRPVIVLRQMPGFGDWLVCGISTQIHQKVVGFDELISSGDKDFLASGLKTTSLIRLGFLAVLPSHAFVGSIGRIAVERHRLLLNRLCQHLTPTQ